MKIKIKKNILEEKLSRAIAIMGSGNIISVPALKSLLFKIYSDKLEIISSSNKASIKCRVLQKPDILEIERTGEFLLSSKNLLELVKRINSDFIVMEKVEENVIAITTNTSRYVLTTYDTITYPKHKFELIGSEITWTVDFFKDISRQVAFAADVENKQQNPALKGVNYFATEKTLRVLATNAHRLSKKDHSGTNEDFNIIMQPQVFKLTPRFLTAQDKEIRVLISSEKIQIILGKDILQFQNLQEKYPDTSKIIPTDFETSVIVNKQEIKNALERINVLSTEEKKVRMKITDEKMLFTAQPNSANSVIEKITSYNKIGRDIDISFSFIYLIDALNAINTVEAKLEFVSNQRPFVVWNNIDKTLLHVISPYRNG